MPTAAVAWLRRPAVQCIIALGYEIVRTGNASLSTWQFGEPCEDPQGTYAPRPFPTDTQATRIPVEMRKLGEMLAENAHDVSDSVFLLVHMRVRWCSTSCSERRACLLSALPSLGFLFLFGFPACCGVV
jgi:hypothetical protein